MTFSSKLSVTTAALAALGLAAAHPAAAQSVITFGAAQNIAGDSDVLTDGILVGAYSFAAASNAAVNGVTFVTRGGGDNGGSNLQVTTFNKGVTGVYGRNAPPFNALSAGYQTILGSGLYRDSPATAPAYFDLSGLTAGNTYEVQFFVNDSRPGTGNRNETLTTGAGKFPNNFTASGDPSVTLNFNTTGAEGGLGQYVVGTFVADSTGTASLAATGNISTQVNAIQYRDLGAPASAAPEPSQLAGLGLAAFGVLGLLFRARKRTSISAAAPTVWGS